MAKKINPDYVNLLASRGFESPNHQFFMRMSVLVSDCLFFISALYFYIKNLKMDNKYKWVFFALCSHPGLTLIDYGHFQYNSVSLGLALWAIIFVSKGRNLWAAVAFSAALNFKQMELYHAIPIFFYLLASCHRKASTLMSQLVNLIKIGVVTLATFALIWYPFLQLHDGLLQQVLSRVFPFNRGIFEDYVANFWCTLNVLVKIRRILEPTSIASYCLLLTALFSFPCGLHLYFKNSLRNLHLCLINVSLAFFLFSYHVHEKSILLVTLPVSIASPYFPFTAFWFLSISHFSMLPLYAKDDLILPAGAVLALYCLLANSSLKLEMGRSMQFKCLAGISAIGSAVLALLFLICPNPPAYPYLWTLLVSVWSFAHFSVFFAYFLYVQFWVGSQSLKLKMQ
ncbi:dolichyl pyrophosphate Man9GlcNAc2 alpha-1,3-glucosyltransferase-like isoform X2 [Daphnia pulex]|nr:dolichyl pyrophosphate Man9GlcNAc2 alpha-1,3-glucosyltransferase-like isoform X2 [Daphnia pulex]